VLESEIKMARAILSEPGIVGAKQCYQNIETPSIDARGLETRELNGQLRELMLSGAKRVNITNVCGQRYIGTRLYTPEHLEMEIEIFGTPGNDLAAFLYGHHKITVHGNAQDGVGNTMDDGEVIVEGRAGDVLGFSMRGGEIYVRDGCGYRTALHMKEYDGKRPVLVVGGRSQDFLGEYMAGGIVIILDLEGQTHKANFIGTGMHGGVIYLRGSVDRSQVGDQVEISPVDEADRKVLDDYVTRFLERFPDVEKRKDEILNSQFVKLAPRSKRPYSNLYAY
jgi:glutamate synthase domain-containing protein 3